MKTRILFVDDEPLMLQLIRSLFESVNAEWDVAFAGGGPEALASMAAQPFDVVVSDMRMAGMSGAELFSHVQKRHPHTVRIIQSGFADHSQIMQAVGVAHQFLTKPFALQNLLNTLERVQDLNRWLMNDDLRSLVARMNCLPSMPTVYFRILDALRSVDSSVDEIAEIISTDPALTAKVLQLVNSAFFGFSRNVQSAGEAVLLLGVNTIRSVALSAHVFMAFEPARHKGIPLEDIWKHSLQTGVLAQKVARHESRDPTLLEQCFTAGTLHDIGKLILAVNVPEQYREVVGRVRSDHVPFIHAERDCFGSSHADVGAYLLGVWGLPVPLVEAVALHHQPAGASQRSFSPLTAVHVANALAETGSSPEDEANSEDEAALLDSAYLEELGLPASVAGWQAALGN
jgi:HD-like signal output (HDOD) protein